MKWQDVGTDGTQVMKVWEVEGADVWPQVSILRVSNATYLKFFQDPRGFMEFVNAEHVFSKDVIEADPWVSLPSVDDKDPSPEWVLATVHGKTSRMLVAALPKLKQEEDRSKMR
jgi:hypothetical protein